MSAISKISKLALFLLLVTVLPGIPPYCEFEAFSVTPPIPLQGALTLNSKLNKAERLFQGEIHGPEDLKVHNGDLYTTLHGGYVARIVNDSSIEHVVKFGQSCDGFHEEDKCGRPLGLSFDTKGSMYVADAYYGIFKVCLTSGKSEQLVSMTEVIEGKQPKIPNAVAVSNDNTVFWTDSSTSHYLHDGIFSCLASGNGRLLQYNPSTKKNKVLLDKLHFPNGVALSDDGSFIVVCETVMHRIVKYHLKGSKAGEMEVFIDGLPGAPDNIHSDKKGGFVVSLILPRSAEHPSLVATLGPYPLLRKLLARLLFMVQSSVVLVRDLYPTDFLKKAAHIIGHFESLPSPSLDQVSVLFLTREGKVSRSMYATDGLSGISDFVEHNGFFYLGSPYNTFLARVNAH